MADRLGDFTRDQRAELAGVDLMRALACLASVGGKPEAAQALYHERFPRTVFSDIVVKAFTTPQTKAAISVGDTVTPTWAGSLVALKPLISIGFLPLLKEASLLGRVQGLRQVPLYTVIPVESASPSFAWVGQGIAKAAAKFGFGTSLTLLPTKAAGTIALTRELGLLMQPGAEQELQNQLVAGAADFTDRAFLDPANAGIATVAPASITHGVTATPTGTTADATLAALSTAFYTALPGARIPTLVASEATLSHFTATHPALDAGGSTLGRFAVVTTPAAPANTLVVFDAARVLYNDSGVEIDASQEASIQMSDTPDNPTTATTVLVSLWQTNLIGYRVERAINWVSAPNAAQWAVLPVLP